MKKAKITEKKEIKEKANTDMNVRGGIIALLGTMVVFLGFYLLTDYLLSNKKTVINTDPPVETKNIAFNQLLSQEESEYVVFAIMEKDTNKNKYNTYAQNLDTVYYIDMSDSFNKSYIGDKTEVGNSIKDIKISDSALFHIKDGKINEYKIGNLEILAYLNK
jgi:hypothetical protein